MPEALYGLRVAGPRSRSVDMSAFLYSNDIPDVGVGVINLPSGALPVNRANVESRVMVGSSSSSSSKALPFPLSSLGPMGVRGDSPLLRLRARSILTVLGNDMRWELSELPLRSICRLARVDAECLCCLCSGNVNNG